MTNKPDAVADALRRLALTAESYRELRIRWDRGQCEAHVLGAAHLRFLNAMADTMITTDRESAMAMASDRSDKPTSAEHMVLESRLGEARAAFEHLKTLGDAVMPFVTIDGSIEKMKAFDALRAALNMPREMNAQHQRTVWKAQGAEEAHKIIAEAARENERKMERMPRGDVPRYTERDLSSAAAMSMNIAARTLEFFAEALRQYKGAQ